MIVVNANDDADYIAHMLIINTIAGMRSVSGLVNVTILAILLLTGKVFIAAVLMSIWTVLEYLWILMNPRK